MYSSLFALIYSVGICVHFLLNTMVLAVTEITLATVRIWLVGWLVGWLVAWLVGCLVGWLLGCLID